METTDFEDVLREACEEVSLDPENLSAQDFRAMRRYARKRLEMAWEYHFWPVLGRVEQRFYRPNWSAVTTYGAATAGQDNSANEVFWPQTQQYFQSLVAGNLNNPPTDDLGNVDNAHWAITYANCWPSNAAESFDSTATYVQTDQVCYAGNWYQLYVAGPVTGVLPTDATQWGLLVAFDAYVDYEQAGLTALGIVAAAWSANPRTTTRGNELNWNLSERGVQILTPHPYAWIDYRIRCPKLSGELFAGDKAYASGATMYYSSDATPGNFYTANQATAAGDSPDTASAKWDVVQLPRIFHKYLVLGIAADWAKNNLRAAEGSPAGAEAQLLLGLAQAALDDQKSLLVGQQSQRVKTVVRTR